MNTQGPWTFTRSYKQSKNEWYMCIFADNSNTHKRPAEVMGMTKEECEANARLIAAAPEMLEAIKELLKMITDNRLHGEEVYNAVSIIAKAEGRE